MLPLHEVEIEIVAVVWLSGLACMAFPCHSAAASGRIRMISKSESILAWLAGSMKAF